MAAYHRVYGFGDPQADFRGPGSAPEAFARFEYGTTLPYLTLLRCATLVLLSLTTTERKLPNKHSHIFSFLFYFYFILCFIFYLCIFLFKAQVLLHGFERGLAIT